jgi:DNA-binding IclR family transcriptional regulator
MGAKSEELARQFEALASEVVAVVETLSNADWMKVTEAERWTVGVTAHHLAGAFEGVARWCAAIASGARVLTDMPPMTVEQLVTSGLITHIKQHVGSIRKTVGA